MRRELEIEVVDAEKLADVPGRQIVEESVEVVGLVPQERTGLALGRRASCRRSNAANI